MPRKKFTVKHQNLETARTRVNKEFETWRRRRSDARVKNIRQYETKSYNERTNKYTYNVKIIFDWE